jgi:polar amino acid transport system permease protein
VGKILASFWDRPDHPAPKWARGLSALALVGLFTLLCWSVLFSAGRNWATIWQYREAYLQGWLMTVLISILGLGLSVVIGFIAALGRRSKFLPVRYLATFYIEGVRGLPFLVLILLIWYGMVNLADRLTTGVFLLALFSGAYLAEIFRAGIESVGRTQWESARAIGLTTAQTYRYVVLPQALRRVLPPLTGQFASIIKDSSLLSIIGLTEFTNRAQNVFSATYAGLESYLPLGLGYLALTIPILLITRKLHKKLAFDT